MSAVAHIDEYKSGKFFEDSFRGELSWNGYENNVLLHNEGNDENGMPRFIDVGMALGADDISDARGMATADLDNDGDLDFIINNNPGDKPDLNGEVSPDILRNDVADGNNWLAITLQGTTVNRDAVGAEVTIRVGDEQQIRLLSGGSSYAGQHTMRLYFGLGQAQAVDSISVRWPGGKTTDYEGQQANQWLHIVEDQQPQSSPLPALQVAAGTSDARSGGN